MPPRRKKNPDTVQLNIVEAPQRRGTVRVRKVRCTSLPEGSSDVQETAASAAQSANCDPLQQGSGSHVDPELGFDDINLEDYTMKEQTCCKRKERWSEAWEQVRNKVVSVRIVAWGSPTKHSCVFCQSASSSVWCSNCGPQPTSARTVLRTSIRGLIFFTQRCSGRYAG